jgi:ATP-binding cassette subfamily B protein
VQESAAHRLPHHFWLVATFEVCAALTSLLLTRVVEYLNTALSYSYTEMVGVRVLDHAALLNLSIHEDPGFHDLIERARDQARERPALIAHLGRLLQQVVRTVFSLVALLYYSLWLGAFLGIGAMVSFIGDSHYAFLAYNLTVFLTQTRRRMEYLHLVAVSRDGTAELRLFGLRNFFVGSFRRLSQQIRLAHTKLAKSRSVNGGLLSAVGTLGYYAAYIYVLIQGIHHVYDVKTVVFLLGLVSQSSSNLQELFSLGSSVADQALSLKDLVEFLRLRPTLSAPLSPRPVPRKISRGFEFINVSFVYPQSTRRVLDNFSFELLLGERVALVGENGAGKTTIVKLITRLYDPTEGQILLDGVDLREYSLTELHKRIGIIFQEFMRYDMTIRDNIAIGQLDQEFGTEVIPDGALDVAAERATADAFIRRFPKQYQQLLGRRFEGGIDLSGGEWQRLALARLFLRNADLMILDEPTAALDAANEMRIFRMLEETTLRKMVLLISHRFSTVRVADRIVMLDKGQIIEEGTHDALLRRGGRYADLFEYQAASYR